LLQIIITATSVQDTKKTGTATLTLDSGISVTMTPATATVPTGEQQNFSVSLTNDLQSLGVTFLLTQGTPTSTVPFPSLTSCSPGCGTIAATGTGNTAATYTAPATIPTTATLTIVATSKADTNRFTVGTITIIQGGPITFNGVSPTIAPQGASLYNVYLDAPFISSSSVITFTGTDPHNSFIINSGTGQVKVLFPIPTSSVTNPPSTGARVQLAAANLQVADAYTVTVTDPAQPVTNGPGPFTVTVVPVRPTSVASIPDGIPQSGTGNDLGLTIDGGYFGSGGLLVTPTFNGNSLAQGSTSFSRQLNLNLPSSDVNSALPGLYQLSVASRATPAPLPNNPSVTNLAVFPDYSGAMPSVVGSAPTGANPAAVDIDTRLGIVAVAEPGANQVEFFRIASHVLTSIGTQKITTSSGAVGVPSGLSINQTNHTAAVVDFQNQGVFVVPLPGQAGDPNITYPLRISLANLIPSTFTPAPLAYSIGVDSDTNNAIVAYSSNANPTTAKIGFLLDLNKDSQACLPSLTSATPPCIHAQVTLNTGQFPQIAMVPHAHQALVTPGGAGIIQGVDVTQTSSSFTIANVSVSSGLVTVTLNIPSGQILSLNPGNPGSVLIQGVPPGSTHNTDFNGVFTIQSVPNSTSFTYVLNAPQNDSVVPDQNPDTAFAFFGSPNISIALSQTAQGISINPITRTAAIADANATGNNGPQIDLLNSLDQSISSITFHAGCTIYSSSCAGSPELLGTSSVAFQPYSNLIVSYNPQQNQVSISNPVNQSRYALVCQSASACQIDPIIPSQVTLAGTGTACVTIPSGGTCTNSGAPPNELNLFGGLAVDPATNQAFVVQSGSSTIQIVDLGSTSSTILKPVEVTELLVPTVSGALIGGIAGASMPQGTLTSATDLGGVKIFGAGFDASSQARLDGTAVPTTFVNNREVDITVPHTFLALPHHYSVDVRNGNGVTSGVTDFFVITSIDMTSATCSAPQPSSVAIADQLSGSGQTFAPIAVVSNSGCKNVAKIDIAPQLPVLTNGVFTGFAPNPNFGHFTTIPTGEGPQGVAVSSRFGMAVVANHTAGTASVLNLKSNTQQVADVTVGASPTGVAIDEGTGTALIANTGDNTVSELNLALLAGSSPATSLTALGIAIDTSPIAVAIDPDRGTNNKGLAVVTALELVSGSAPIGVLDAIDLGGATPVKSTTAQVGTVTSTPTGIVFNPTVSPTLFYATSSGGNVVTTFNPNNGSTTSARVGVNPTSLAINPQTGGIITINSSSHTISILDTISNPFKTRNTFGLGGSPQFGVAIDQFTNLAVLADQANNRVLIFPVPN
jgi:DNA-binding beta-propeller fold protein YncE